VNIMLDSNEEINENLFDLKISLEILRDLPRKIQNLLKSYIKEPKKIIRYLIKSRKIEPLLSRKELLNRFFDDSEILNDAKKLALKFFLNEKVSKTKIIIIIYE
jgi:hypothetical protein